MSVITLEHLKDEDSIPMNLVPLTRDNETADTTSFYESYLKVKTEKSTRVRAIVALSGWNWKPRIYIKVPPALKEKLLLLNGLITKRLLTIFDNVYVRPWITTDMTWICFALPKRQLADKRLGPVYIEIEEPGYGSTIVYGASGIYDRLDGKELCVQLEFDFRCVYKKGDAVGFIPCLMKLCDYTPAATMIGYETA
jgi:hypothetical protein